MNVRMFKMWEVGASTLLIALGVYVTWQGADYSLGTTRRLGSGAVPVGLGIAMVGLGIATLFETLRENAPPPDFALRPFMAVLLSMVAWTILAPRFGLVPATVSLVMICALAQRPMRLISAAIAAAVLSAAGVLIFLTGLRIPLKSFDW